MADRPTPHPPFRLHEWLVEPSLNRLRRADAAPEAAPADAEVTVRLEPKLMDVLCFLAAHPGRVVSKDEVADAVWTDLFITESVITRAISGLRRALGDATREPRFIETITKRGYRLLPDPLPVAAPAPGHRPKAAPTAGDTRRGAGPTSTALHPFRVGQWVRGRDFFGREAILAEVLHGSRNGLWLLGTRAIGKTSTLKQLELLAASQSHEQPQGSWFPLFWDLQGCERMAELDAAFAEVLADAAERLEPLGLDGGELAGVGFLDALGPLRRALRRSGRSLLLLIDEAEELVALHRTTPALLRKLRRTLLATGGIRTVLAASGRLWQLAEQRDDTSPFLHGFAPPLALGPLTEPAARRLLTEQGRIDETDAERILEITGRHPSLMKMMAGHVLQEGNLEAAEAAVAADPTTRFLFAVDFDLLAPAERRCLVALATQPDRSPAEQDAHDEPSLHQLETLGLVAPDPGSGAPRVASSLLAGWLRREGAQKV